MKQEVLGNIITFAHKTKSYNILVGQNVPDDLIPADATFLIECFMKQEFIRVNNVRWKLSQAKT